VGYRDPSVLDLGFSRKLAFRFNQLPPNCPWKVGKWESGKTGKAGKRGRGKAGKRESGKAGKRESGEAGKRDVG
jgi:hypothetical protein